MSQEHLKSVFPAENRQIFPEKCIFQNADFISRGQGSSAGTAIIRCMVPAVLENKGSDGKAGK